MDMNILVLGKLDEALTTQQMNTQLDTIRKKLQGITLKINIDTAAVDSIRTAIVENKALTASLAQQSTVAQANIAQLDRYSEVFRGVGATAEEIVARKREWTNELGHVVKQVQTIDAVTGDVSKTVEETTQNFKAQRLEKQKLANAMARDLKAQRLEEQKLANAMARGRESSFNRQRAVDRSSELQQSKAINAAIEKENILRRTRIDTFPALKGVQLSEAALSQVLTQTYGEKLQKITKIDFATGAWSASLRESATHNRILRGTVDQTTGALHVQSNVITEVKNRNLGMISEVGIAMRRIPTWFISMTLYMQAMRFFTQGLAHVNNLNKSLTEIAIVTGKSQSQVNALGKEYQELAYILGSTTQGVAEASVTFYRQGLTQVEVMERVRVATQFATIANIDFADASKILTATVNSMGVPIERAADVMTYLGDATATEAAEIGRALQKVGGSAAAAGLEYEKLASWIATISSRTREGAETIGTSLKTIVARYRQITETGFSEEDGTGINQVARALAEVGIQVKDETGRFRDFGDVMDELGMKWEELAARPDNVTDYIATTMAGVRQKDRLLNLLNAYSESVRLYEGALLATGSAQRKHNVYLQSTEAHLNKLQTSYTKIWQNVFQSEDIRTAISLLTGLTKGIGALIETFGLFPVLIPTILSGFALFNASVKTAMATTSAWLLMMAGFKGAPIWLGIAAVSALTYALTRGVGALSAHAEASRVAQANQKNAVSTYRAHGKEVDRLVARYGELSGKQARTAEETAELEVVQGRLREMLPSVTTALDAHGNTHMRNVDKIDAEIVELRKLVAEYEKFEARTRANEAARIQRQMSSTESLISQRRAELFRLQSLMATNPDAMPQNEYDNRVRELQRDITNLTAALTTLRETATLANRVTETVVAPKTPLEPSDTGTTTSAERNVFILSASFERRLQVINAQLETLQQNLDAASDLEQRQNIYKQIASVYDTQQSLLSQKLAWQRQELTRAQAVLKTVLSASNYNKIISGNYEAIEVTNEAASNAIDAFQDLTDEILSTEEAIRNATVATRELGQAAQKDIADNYAEWLKNTADVADDIVDAYKDMYQQQRDARLRENRDAMDMENRRHERVMDNLQEQLDQYEELIDAKLKALDQEEDSEDYYRSLTEAQTERQKTVDQISLLSLDNSIGAKARRARLSQQLAEQDARIAEMQTGRSRDLRRQNLQDNLAEYKKTMSAQEQVEQDKHEATKLRIEQEREAWTNYYDNLIADERRWSSVRQAIMEGDKAKIDSILADLKNVGFPTMVAELDTAMKIAGQSIQQNLTDRLLAARNALSSVSHNVPLPTGVNRAGAPIPTTPTHESSIALRQFAAQQGVNVGWSAVRDTVVFGLREYTRAQLEQLGLFLKNGHWFGSARSLSQLVPFHGGGGIPQLPGNGDGIALVRQKEHVFDEKDTSNLLAAVRFLDKMMPRFNAPQVATGAAGITLNFHVDRMYGTDKEAKGFATKIMGELYKSGVK